MVMRTAPSSSAENTANPFLMRIKEVPQTNDRKIRINQAQNSVEKRPDRFVVSMMVPLSVQDPAKIPLINFVNPPGCLFE